MAVLNYALYELVLKLRPNGSAEDIKNKFNRQLKIINEIENDENNNSIIAAIDTIAQNLLVSNMKTSDNYITYSHDQLNHKEIDKFLSAKYIKCCLYDDEDPEEMRD